MDDKEMLEDLIAAAVDGTVRAVSNPPPGEDVRFHRGLNLPRQLPF